MPLVPVRVIQVLFPYSEKSNLNTNSSSTLQFKDPITDVEAFRWFDCKPFAGKPVDLRVRLFETH